MIMFKTSKEINSWNPIIVSGDKNEQDSKTKIINKSLKEMNQRAGG